MGKITDKVLNKLYYRMRAARQAWLDETLERSGNEGSISAEVDVRYIENISIGARSYVNGGMLAASPNAHILIGEDCMLSYGVHLRTDMHRHGDIDVPMNQQGHDEADIVIGNDVWVGYGAQIMSGVTIGSHSIVGAGAVVTHDVPEFAVVGGVPARLLKWRKPVDVRE